MSPDARRVLSVPKAFAGRTLPLCFTWALAYTPVPAGGMPCVSEKAVIDVCLARRGAPRYDSCNLAITPSTYGP